MVFKRVALIVAGGSGLRMNAHIPKQFLLLNGLPVLMHTLKLFNSINPPLQIVLALPNNEFETWETLCKKHSFSVPHLLVAGGETRFHSVKNGLEAINDEGFIAIHDGVRPLVNTETIEKCFEVAMLKGNAVPAIRPNESVRIGTPESNRVENRDNLWLVQTPQVFSIEAIKRYYQTEFKATYTDDASVAEANGETIYLVEGNRENIKITTPTDLLIAEKLLKERDAL